MIPPARNPAILHHDVKGIKIYFWPPHSLSRIFFPAFTPLIKCAEHPACALYFCLRNIPHPFRIARSRFSARPSIYSASSRHYLHFSLAPLEQSSSSHNFQKGIQAGDSKEESSNGERQRHRSSPICHPQPEMSERRACPSSPSQTSHSLSL
jgi:hypothetical protein